ncbi:hypothetical protein GQ53DRAFT_761135 [Thozetella sp. PMI_491]|nr:hypothetical protein GQ53DRAFT_761135 [Thozetella sp. PMI_491]
MSSHTMEQSPWSSSEDLFESFIALGSFAAANDLNRDDTFPTSSCATAEDLFCRDGIDESYYIDDGDNEDDGSDEDNGFMLPSPIPDTPTGNDFEGNISIRSSPSPHHQNRHVVFWSPHHELEEEKKTNGQLYGQKSRADFSLKRQPRLPKR